MPSREIWNDELSIIDIHITDDCVTLSEEFEHCTWTVSLKRDFVYCDLDILYLFLFTERVNHCSRLGITTI